MVLGLLAGPFINLRLARLLLSHLKALMEPTHDLHEIYGSIMVKLVHGEKKKKDQR